jgi:Cu/Ag efflux pump CusA
MAIATRHGITLIRRLQQLTDEGQTFGPELVLRGAADRVGPVVMSTLGIGLALLPLVIGGWTPGLELLRPTALVVLGGLATSVLVTLFLLPTLCLRFATRPAGAMPISQPSLPPQ